MSEWKLRVRHHEIKGKNLKGDWVAFFVAPLIFLALVFVTAVLVVAFQDAAPILNTTAQAFHENSTYQNIPIKISTNLNNMNTYLPIVFYFIMMAIIISSIIFDSDPISWLVGIIYLPFIYYVSAYLSNIARSVLIQPLIQNGVAVLPAPIYILANLPVITFLFGLIYIVALAVRIWFFPIGNQGMVRR